jgi:hypothetical protein
MENPPLPHGRGPDFSQLCGCFQTTQEGVMLIAYRAIALFLAVLVSMVIVRERGMTRKITGGMVLVLLILRAFLVK